MTATASVKTTDGRETKTLARDRIAPLWVSSVVVVAEPRKTLPGSRFDPLSPNQIPSPTDDAANMLITAVYHTHTLYMDTHRVQHFGPSGFLSKASSAAQSLQTPCQ